MHFLSFFLASDTEHKMLSLILKHLIYVSQYTLLAMFLQELQNLTNKEQIKGWSSCYTKITLKVLLMLTSLTGKKVNIRLKSYRVGVIKGCTFVSFIQSLLILREKLIKDIFGPETNSSWMDTETVIESEE